jgi:hypothetical protein
VTATKSPFTSILAWMSNIKMILQSECLIAADHSTCSYLKLIFKDFGEIKCRKRNAQLLGNIIIV